MNGNEQFIAMCKKIGIEWPTAQENRGIASVIYSTNRIDVDLARALVSWVNIYVNPDHKFDYYWNGGLSWSYTVTNIDELFRRRLLKDPDDSTWSHKLLLMVQAKEPEAFKLAYKSDSYPPIDVSHPMPDEPTAEENKPKVDPMPLAVYGDYSPELIAQELLRAIKLSQGTAKASEDPYTRVLLGKLIDVYFSTDEGHKVPRGDSYVELLIDKAKREIHHTQRQNELESERAKHKFHQSETFSRHIPGRPPMREAEALPIPIQVHS